MSADTDKLYLIEVSSNEHFGPLSGSKGDIVFPEKVRGWSDVLDCRHKPSTEMDRDELVHYAEHVNKFFCLVEEGALGLEEPPKEESPLEESPQEEPLPEAPSEQPQDEQANQEPEH